MPKTRSTAPTRPARPANVAPPPPPPPQPDVEDTAGKDPYAGRKTEASEHPTATYGDKTETMTLAFRCQEKGGHRSFSHPLNRASVYLSKGMFRPGFVVPSNFTVEITVRVPKGETRVLSVAGEGGPHRTVRPTITSAEQLAEARAKFERQKEIHARRAANLKRQEAQLAQAEEILEG